MNAISYLPNKLIEIIQLLYNKELRIYLPIEELNILLEPIKTRGELEKEEELNEKIDLNYETDSTVTIKSYSSDFSESSDYDENNKNKNDDILSNSDKSFDELNLKDL